MDTLDSEGVFLACYQSRKTIVTAALSTARKTGCKIQRKALRLLTF